MAASRSPSVADTLRRYFPLVPESIGALCSHAGAEIDGPKISSVLFPHIAYSDNEKADINQEITRSAHVSNREGEGKGYSNRLGELNVYLSTRTTLLGNKPSVADIILYTQLAPLVKSWSREQRTGIDGFHHIVRYVDFIQNSASVGITMTCEERVDIRPGDVLFVPKPLSPKDEKERKKKEKTAKAAADEDRPVPHSESMVSSEQVFTKAKSIIQGIEDSVKSTVAGESLRGKKGKKAKAPKATEAPIKDKPLSPALIDLRVGHILKVEVHPNADSLFVSTIAVGDEPGTDNTSEYAGQVVRTVCSGLNGLIPLDEMQNRKIVAVCNLKPVTMRGIKSTAMVLAASPRLAEGETDNHSGPVELVAPPTSASVGERVLFDGWDGDPEAMLNPKKKIWDMCQIGFTTTEHCEVAFEKARVQQLGGDGGTGKPDTAKLRVTGGDLCMVKTLKGAVVR
ncbi:MAG: G4 quadruplex nucleic acid binding protein [Stictis urceolatum]|nr:G4 quadruplex nucleic acid binding protein [Stictis urceolata]